jgi:hypothetical protein
MSLQPVTPGAVYGASADIMADADRMLLRQAARNLEHRSLTNRLSLLFGRQMSIVGKLLPAHLTALVDKAAERAIRIGLTTAIRSLNHEQERDRRGWHKAAATLSGAVGGAFGLASLPVELPISTLLMLRSIAAIAQAEGEDLREPEAALACLQVFALGSQDAAETRLAETDRSAPRSTSTRSASPEGASTEGGYFAVKAVLAQSVTEAARYLVERGMVEESAPIMLRFVSQIATRFGLVVSEKVAVQAVPLIGAAGGAAINYAFIDHFQILARGHFTVRRLERIYGQDVVRAEYNAALRESAGNYAS